MEVTDLDNNFIKESVEFSEPSFRMNFQNLLEVASESELQNSHFLLESHFETELQNSHFGMQKKELDFLLCYTVTSLFLCVLFERNGALFIALREG